MSSAFALHLVNSPAKTLLSRSADTPTKLAVTGTSQTTDAGLGCKHSPLPLASQSKHLLVRRSLSLSPLLMAMSMGGAAAPGRGHSCPWRDLCRPPRRLAHQSPRSAASQKATACQRHAASQRSPRAHRTPGAQGETTRRPGQEVTRSRADTGSRVALGGPGGVQRRCPED